MSQNEKKLIFLFTALILLASYNFKVLADENEKLMQIKEKEKIMQNAYQKNFGSIELEAKSAYVFDLDDGRIIYKKNETEIMSLASITKIMTAIVAFESMSENQVITIRKDDLDQEGDNDFFVNEKWDLLSIIKFMLFTSSNDAAQAIAYKGGEISDGNGTNNISIFVEKMNKKAQELNLKSLNFKNPSGLDIDSFNLGGIGGARDVGLLFAYAFKKYPEIFEPTSYSNFKFMSLSNKEHFVKNTNVFAENFPQILASKTGFTRFAGGNLVVSFDIGIGHPVALVILGSSENGRFQDALKLATITIRYLQEVGNNKKYEGS